MSGIDPPTRLISPVGLSLVIPKQYSKLLFVKLSIFSLFSKQSCSFLVYLSGILTISSVSLSSVISATRSGCDFLHIFTQRISMLPFPMTHKTKNYEIR